MDAPDPRIRIHLSSYPLRWRVPFTDGELRLALLAMWRCFSEQPHKLLPQVPLDSFFVCLGAPSISCHLSQSTEKPSSCSTSISLCASAPLCAQDSLSPQRPNVAPHAGTACCVSVPTEMAPLFPCELELAIMSDSEIAELNESFLGAPSPTNILAFLSGGGEALGWLALSADTMRREAWLYGQPLEAYTLKLLAHGFAHLLGHEHGDVMDQASALAAAAAAEALTQTCSYACRTM